MQVICIVLLKHHWVKLQTKRTVVVGTRSSLARILWQVLSS